MTKADDLMRNDPIGEAQSRPSRLVVYGVLFVAGAVTLALEVTASRLLTPYVGGGLTVWTAILSVTLLALALGYHLGSRWSLRDARRRFIGVPALSALLLAFVAAAVPTLLPTLTQAGALSGAFLGATLILAPVLVLLSAMGPLAVALSRTDRGDGGAGEAFAVSTVGSVAGVHLASFALLPLMSPTATLTALAVTLAAASGAAAVGLRAPRALAVAALVVLAALAFAPASGPEEIAGEDLRVRHVATERSPQATIVVADFIRVGSPGLVRGYLEENQLQSAFATEIPGHPLGYVAVSNALIEATAPQGGSVLVLGLAGGVGASALARAGYVVEAVDINPAAVEVARRWFGLAPEVDVTIADARRRVARCETRHDAIFVDVYSGAEIPEHLVTREFFAAAADCLTETGALVVNAVAPPLDAPPTRRLVAAIAAATGAPVAAYAEETGADRRDNLVLLSRKGGAAAPTIDVAHYPTTLFERTPLTLSPRVLTRADLAGVEPLTDWSNDFALSLALTTPVPRGAALPVEWR